MTAKQIHEAVFKHYRESREVDSALTILYRNHQVTREKGHGKQGGYGYMVAKGSGVDSDKGADNS